MFSIERGLAGLCGFALILFYRAILLNPGASHGVAQESHTRRVSDHSPYSFAEKNWTNLALGRSNSFVGQSLATVSSNLMNTEDDLKLRMDLPRYAALSPRQKYLLNLADAERKGTPPLVLASTFGDLDMVKSLISEGVDPSATPGDTALMVASRFGFADIVEVLLDAGAQIEMQDQRGATALIIAAENSHATIAKLLLARGANPRFVTIHGRTFLHAAVAGGDMDIVKLALQHRYEINARSENGTTPLLLAAR